MPPFLVSDPKSYTIYFGGELFSAKHLLGNAVLAEAICHRSHGKYLPVLPQNLEQRKVTAHSIRDQDILALLDCDLGLFNYDGPDLDSGTVVEFLFAKFADIPSVLVRTDFRSAGDHEQGGDPWNLMTSFFPRTRVILQNSMTVYQKATVLEAGADHRTGLDAKCYSAAGQKMVDQAADDIIQAFDEVLAVSPVLPAHLGEAVYQWLSMMPGFRSRVESGVSERLQALLAAKRAKGLL